LKDLQLETPFLGQFRQKSEAQNRNIFRIETVDLNMFFEGKNIRKPTNMGEERISLQILEKVNYIKGLTQLLDTSQYTGVVGDKEDIDRRHKVFGQHKISTPRLESFLWTKLPRQFEDKNTINLIWAANFYLFFGFFSSGTAAFVECLMIFFGLFMAAFIQAACEYTRDSKWLQLQGEIGDQDITVFRGNGEARTVKITDLVVGDVILLDSGNRVPADCILFEEMNMTVDESTYKKPTEELDTTKISKSVSVAFDKAKEIDIDGVEGNCEPKLYMDNHKQNPDPFLLAMSTVRTGQGKALVCAVGKHTRIERNRTQGDFNMNDYNEVKSDVTQLEKKLTTIAHHVEQIAYVVITAVVLIRAVFRFFMSSFGEQNLLTTQTLVYGASIGIFGIVLLVVIIPEGLALAAQIAMALSINVLKEHKIMVKNVDAIQKASTITDVCVSKTGVLTSGDGKVIKVHVSGKVWDVQEFRGEEIENKQIFA